MIYNPLLERFLRPTETIAAGHAYGFDVTLGMEQDAELQGIPVHVTLETICSLDYLKFSCGVSLIYAIVNRMDRLMVNNSTVLLSISLIIFRDAVRYEIVSRGRLYSLWITRRWRSFIPCTRRFRETMARRRFEKK